MNNYILLSTDLITNFKPQVFGKFNKMDFLKKNKKQIFCKNFFIFLLLLKFKNNNIFNKSSVFIKPFKKKIYTILRSPYRHKLARHQITLKRYQVRSTVKINVKNDIIMNNFKNLIDLVKLLNNYSNWFESNLVFNHKCKFLFNFYYKNNFLIKKFDIKNK